MAFKTVEPPKGYGIDLPDETGIVEGLKIDPPIQLPEKEPEVKYPYNNVTKYLAGHKIEFNNTPGSEYINIQHGTSPTRITLFSDGNIEIINAGGSRLDDVAETHQLVSGEKLETKTGARVSDQKSYVSTSTSTTVIKAGDSVVIDAPLITFTGDIHVKGTLDINDFNSPRTSSRVTTTNPYTDDQLEATDVEDIT